MKKRLRKKYRVGEFRELCFEFTFDYKGDVESPECEAFLRQFVDECIDANGLETNGLLTYDRKLCKVTAEIMAPVAEALQKALEK